MSQETINERAEQVKRDDEKINGFVEEYKPFISSCVQKATGRYVRYGEDDELSIGLMAFVEAIHAYEMNKGNFLTFARGIIKRRLIDYYRKEKKHHQLISLEETLDRDDETEWDVSDGIAIERYKQKQIEEARRNEIEELQAELKRWDITFSDLVESSPKHDKTKKICREVIEYILKNTELLKTIMEKKYIPIQEIEKNLHIPRKNIERARKYIIAVLLIKGSEFQYIREFIEF